MSPSGRNEIMILQQFIVICFDINELLSADRNSLETLTFQIIFMIYFIIQRFYSRKVLKELVDRSIFLTSGNLWASSEPGQWRSNFPRE
jgi:hypothetical protein